MPAQPRDVRRPVLLVILDGFGVNPSRLNNAIYEARTPNFDRYFAEYPHTILKASGRAVGLPEGQMGNSEVGHMTLGSGIVFRQYLVMINDAIATGSFFRNETLLAAARRAKAQNRPLHLLGLVSTGGVHSHLDHLLALIELCRRERVAPWVHLITDGRDTAPTSGLGFARRVEAAARAAEGRIVTVFGRYYAMDRDNRWPRTERAWRAMVRREGSTADSAEEAIAAAYAAGQTDEFIEPVVLDKECRLDASDTVLFFNFRNDRTRQITAALAMSEFHGFDRGDYQPLEVVCMTEYSANFHLPVAFAAERPTVTLGEVVSRAGLKQFRCAETEKYAHVTFFLNGGREHPFPGEDRVMIPSPPVATYDLAPEMSARGVADATIEAMRRHEYALVVVNFANGDMVGHTAVRRAIVEAVEVLDREVGRVLDAAVETGYSVVLTADHGNCEEMIDPATGAPHTQHSVYPVPCLIIDAHYWRLSTNAGLSSVTPTILQLMGLEKPEQMTGQSLLLVPVAHYTGKAG